MTKYEMFYRVNDDGNAVIFHEDGTVVASMDANVYPVDSNLSVRYVHPAGIILKIEDAEKIGIRQEM